MVTGTNTRVIQASLPGTGSTFVANLVSGLICPDARISYMPRKVPVKFKMMEEALLIKSHNRNPLKLIEKFKVYDIYIIVTTRGELRYDQEVLDHPRVLEIVYDDILETPERSLDNVVAALSARILDFLPSDIVPDLPRADLMANALNRIHGMNRVVAELSDEPFERYDKFYHIHGSHRNRAEKLEKAARLVEASGAAERDIGAQDGKSWFSSILPEGRRFLRRLWYRRRHDVPDRHDPDQAGR